MMKNYRLQKTLDGRFNRNTVERRLHLMSFQDSPVRHLAYAVACVGFTLAGFSLKEYSNYLWLAALFCYTKIAIKEGWRKGFLEAHKLGYEDCLADNRGLTDKEVAEFEQMELESSIEIEKFSNP